MVDTVGGGYIFSMFQGADVLRLWWIDAVLWALTAAVLVFLSPQMTQRPSLTNSESQYSPA
jgi:hypothetical protein